MVKASKSPRAWQRMLSGRILDLLDPSPVDIEIIDIAHGLSFLARWNGQTVGDFPYSVAEHSLLVEQIYSHLNPKASTKWKIIALLHDAPEYVIGDMISPVKSKVGPGYEELDDRLMSAILLQKVKKDIKQADKISAWLEAVQIAGFEETEADKIFGAPNKNLKKVFSITLRSPKAVRRSFEERFLQLLQHFN